MEERPSLVDAPKILALRSIPAEAAPGDTVSYEALFVGTEDSTGDPETLFWQYCLLRKPLTASGTIHPGCLDDKGAGITALGKGRKVVEAVVADDACELFGPTPPVSTETGASLRAADPDTTGGYYQPVVLRESVGANNTYAVGVTRLVCGIGAAAQDQVIDYNKHYRRNENPRLDEILIDDGRTTTKVRFGDEAVPTVAVRAGSTVEMEVAWPTCPRTSQCGDRICSVDETVDQCEKDCSTPTGCLGAETYLMFDPVSRSLIEESEQLRVSWYAIAGGFDHDRTAANVATRPNTSSNKWTAPLTAGTVRFWVVLRDDRRGVGWQTFDLTVMK
jgi:hypothetical protein